MGARSNNNRARGASWTRSQCRLRSAQRANVQGPSRGQLKMPPPNLSAANRAVRATALVLGRLCCQAPGGAVLLRRFHKLSHQCPGHGLTFALQLLRPGGGSQRAAVRAPGPLTVPPSRPEVREQVAESSCSGCAVRATPGPLRVRCWKNGRIVQNGSEPFWYWSGLQIWRRLQATTARLAYRGPVAAVAPAGGRAP